MKEFSTQEQRGAETKSEHPERTDSHDSTVTQELRVIMVVKKTEELMRK